jgi:hypothetical protein
LKKEGRGKKEEGRRKREEGKLLSLYLSPVCAFGV